METKTRNKTLRKPSSSKKSIGLNVFTLEDGKKQASITIDDTKSIDPGFFSFLTAESASALKKPWIRLERGARIQKFRQFADEYNDNSEESKSLTSSEKEILVKFLISCNDSKQLNSKQAVVYDLEETKIKDIKGLKMVKDEKDDISFKIEASRPTKRSKQSESKIEIV
jgi:hypothetical protein